MTDQTQDDMIRIPTRPKLRTLSGHRQPVVYISAAGQEAEQYQEIMALKDIDYVSQAIALAALFNDAIDRATGQFDAARARDLIYDYNAMLPESDRAYKLAIMKTYQSTVSQKQSLVSGMIDKIVEVLKNAIGVALGQATIEQITAAVTDAFTNLKSQEGDAWIFWEKREAQKTVYSYAILFAIQDDTTGRVMLAFPMSLQIEVDIAYERVLWITVKDTESYSVKIDAMQVAQLLFPKTPAIATAQRMALTNSIRRRNAVDASQPVTDIVVTNWARSITYATATNGDLLVDGALTQLMAFAPTIHSPVYEENKYLIRYTLNGQTQFIGMTLNATMPDGTLWFVSQ